MEAHDHFSTYRPVRLLRPEPKIAPERPATFRRTFKRLFLVAAVIAFGVVLFSVENTAKLLADLAVAMIVPRVPEFTQASQTPSDSRVSSIAKLQPIGGEYSETTLVEPPRLDVKTPTSETLLRQFQAWAAEQDAQQLATAQTDQDRSSSLKTIPGRAVEEAVGSTGLGPKDRGSRSAPKARTKASPQTPQKEIRQTQSARVQVAPTQRNEAKFSQASVVRN